MKQYYASPRAGEASITMIMTIAVSAIILLGLMSFVNGSLWVQVQQEVAAVFSSNGDSNHDTDSESNVGPVRTRLPASRNSTGGPRTNDESATESDSPQGNSSKSDGQIDAISDGIVKKATIQLASDLREEVLEGMRKRLAEIIRDKQLVGTVIDSARKELATAELSAEQRSALQDYVMAMRKHLKLELEDEEMFLKDRLVIAEQFKHVAPTLGMMGALDEMFQQDRDNRLLKQNGGTLDEFHSAYLNSWEQVGNVLASPLNLPLKGMKGVTGGIALDAAARNASRAIGAQMFSVFNRTAHWLYNNGYVSRPPRFPIDWKPQGQ
ncbi:MAG: hypothetical protein R3C28_26725 [Pirellulaceae bacterium]